MMFRRVMLCGAIFYIYRQTLTIAFFPRQMSLQQQKYLLFSLSPISFQICFCSFLLFFFTRSLQKVPEHDVYRVCMEWNTLYYIHIAKYIRTYSTIFFAYSTFSNVVKIYFVCLFVCCVFFLSFLS